MSRLVVEGGTVVTAAGSAPADVLVDGEKVAALLAPGGAPVSSDLVRLDARGKLVVPGGIDVHTHMEMPFGGTYSADTFSTGTRAAAHGGTTTIVDFAIQPRGGSAREGLDTWMARAEGHCAIDFGFHMILSDVNEPVLGEMPGLVAEGVTSFKLFMAYPGVFYSDDGKILTAMQAAADAGALVMMHAENGIAIDVLVAQALAAGKGEPRMPGRPARRSWRARRPIVRSCSQGWRTAPSTSSTSRRRRRSRRWPQPVTPGGRSSRRPAPSTCSWTPRSWRARTWRVRSTSARPR